MSTNADPLDTILRRAAPVDQASLDTPEVHDAIGAMLAQAHSRGDVDGQDGADVLPLTGERTGSRTAARRRTTVFRAAVATSLVLAAGTGVAAATGFLELHTGVFGEPGMTENDTSELLRAASPEVPDLLRSYVAELPLAPGFDAEPLIDRFMAGDHGLVQADGLRGQTFFWSVCSWELSWLDAHAAGDAEAQDRATVQLARFPDEPVLGDIDGAGVTESLRQIAAAAQAGDPRPIQRDTDVNCDLDIAR